MSEPELSSSGELARSLVVKNEIWQLFYAHIQTFWVFLALPSNKLPHPFIQCAL